MKLRLILFSLSAVLILSACKTTEQNYRNAYQVAKENTRNKVDPETDARLNSERNGRTIDFNGKKISVTTGYFDFVDDSDTNVPTGQFAVVVGKFKQIFNARMFKTRLADKKYPAYILFNADKEYFVIVRDFASQNEAAQYITDIKSHIPFPIPIEPFILRNLSVQ